MARRLTARGKRIPQFWSHSRYATWRDCAYKYLLKHVLKLPEEKSYAMERGIDIHSKFEQVLLGNIRGIPNELKLMKNEILNMKKLEAEPEVSWTLTKELTHTHPKDWNGAWLRAKVDVHFYFEDDEELLIVDLKTGRFKVAQSQMDLYAAMAPFYYPDAKNIIVELWFSDHGEVHSEEYGVRKAKQLWKKWERRAADMLSDRKFIPSPGAACRYCPYKSSKKMPNGEFGPCKEWKKAK